MFKDLFSNLLSGSDKASSNRLIGILMVIFLIVYIVLSSFTFDVNIKVYIYSLLAIFGIIISALGMKDIVKIFSLFLNKKANKEEEE